MPNETTAPEKVALTAAEVSVMINVSIRTVFAVAANDATFPPSIRIGAGPQPRSRRWLRAEILKWLEERAPRDAPPSRRRS